MERESLLVVLIALLAGSAIIAGAGISTRVRADARAVVQLSERRLWWRIWRPLIPAALIAAALCGWALAEPDPVPEHVPVTILIASVPFVGLFARAMVRAGWSLVRDDGDPEIATVGVVKPRIVISPHLARALDERALEAAIEHERAHARRRDPARIWLAQIATDLQWPWPQAQERFRCWIVALELARDEEARATGADGLDLARAIIAVARIRRGYPLATLAALTGEESVLKERIDRLIRPELEPAAPAVSGWRPVWLLAGGIAASIALGLFFGEAAVAALLRLAA